MKVRPSSSFMSLDESMERVVDIESREQLMRYLREHYDFWRPTEENVTCEEYGFDERIGWDTHLICVDGKAALISDGPLPEGEA